MLDCGFNNDQFFLKEERNNYVPFIKLVDTFCENQFRQTIVCHSISLIVIAINLCAFLD